MRNNFGPGIFHTSQNIPQLRLAQCVQVIDFMVAREGIEQHAQGLLITAFLNDRKLSYPRCYPQSIWRKTATEPGTLAQFQENFKWSYPPFTLHVVVIGMGLNIYLDTTNYHSQS